MAKRKKKQLKRQSGKVSNVNPVSVPGLIVRSMSRLDYLKLGLIVLICFAIYFQTRNFDFVLDDKLVYSENSYVQEGWKGWKKIWTEDSFAGYFQGQRNLVEGARYRPLSLLSFAMEKALWGGGPRWAHVINIILFACALMALYKVLYVFFPQYNDRKLNVADIGTLLFALHPVHTEAVANIKGRDEILAFLFSMLCLWLLWRYVKEAKGLFFIGSVLCLLLGILSKEHVLSLVVLAPLAMWYFAGVELRKALRIFGVFIAAAILYIGWRYYVVGFSGSENLEFQSLMNNPFLEMSPPEKWATILYTLGLYAKLLVFPHPLTHDYYPYHIPIMHWTDSRVIVSGILYFALLYLAFTGLKRKRYYSYAILFYLGSLFIVSNIPFPIGTFMNERFLFLPSFGFVIVLAVGLMRGFYSMKWYPVSLALSILFILGYGWKTLSRIPDWKDGFTLNQSAVKISKNSARINLFMGVSHFQMAKSAKAAEKEKHLELADHYFSKATRIVPDYFDAWKMKAGVLAEQFKMDRDVAHLLNGFHDIILHKPGIPYINEYISYLKKRNQYTGKLLQFLDDVGYGELYKRQEYAYALHYLTMGEDIATSAEYFNHIAMVYEAFAREQQKVARPSYNPKLLLQRAQSYKEKALSLYRN